MDITNTHEFNFVNDISFGSVQSLFLGEEEIEIIDGSIVHELHDEQDDADLREAIIYRGSKQDFINSAAYDLLKDVDLCAMCREVDWSLVFIVDTDAELAEEVRKHV